MRAFLVVSFLILLCGGLAAVASAEQHVTAIPPGIDPVPPSTDGPRVPCDMLLRYDDGSDDTPGSGPTLGYWTGVDYQFLGVRFTPPGGASYLVQSASWYSDFWVLAGQVDVTATDLSDPTNTTTATIAVNNGGTWEVEFTSPICIPAGGDYSIMICPHVGCFGVVGQDLSGSAGRSYWSMSPGGCTLVNPTTDNYMIWSCVTPCAPVPANQTTWGTIKGLYR
jgi:hypothetical protein